MRYEIPINGAIWYADDPRFDGGLKVTLTVTDPDGALVHSDRPNLDRANVRAAFAEKAGIDVHDLLTVRETLIECLESSHDTRESGEPETEDLPAYFEGDGGLFWRRATRDGSIDVQLTNFLVRIVGEIEATDGVETTLSFEMQARIEPCDHRFQITATEFASMNWVTRQLGARAVMYPGHNLKDRARAAIQLLSGEIPRRRIFTHTGWTDVDGQRVYLHAGGAIGADGSLHGVEVALPSGLDKYRLSEPVAADDLATAVRASLAITAVAPEHVTYLILAATYAAPAGPIPESLHIVGPTGAGKSQLMALAQQHFGLFMDAEHFPGSWDATANALEDLAFRAKDTLFIIDDFAPNQRGSDAQKMHRDADRLFRAKANQSGRTRMRADTSLRLAKPPRSVLVSTGEDHLRGASLRARVLTLELGPDDVDWEHLIKCQSDATAGRYAAAMGSYIQWLAAMYPAIVGTPDLWGAVQSDEIAAIAANADLHRRTPMGLRKLAAGFRIYLDFAIDVGAIAIEEAEQHWQRAIRALETVAAGQVGFQETAEPTRQFADLLSSAIASGRAHVAATDGNPPASPQSWGWRSQRVGTGDFQRDEWKPCGERIGWTKDGDLYLDRDAAVSSVRRMASDSSEPFSLGRDTLAKRLSERGHLLSMDQKRQVLSVRRMVEGRRLNVWHLSTSFVHPPATEADMHGPETDQGDQLDHKPDHQECDGHGKDGANGRVGQVAGARESKREDPARDVGSATDPVCRECRNPISRRLSSETGVPLRRYPDEFRHHCVVAGKVSHGTGSCMRKQSFFGERQIIETVLRQTQQAITSLLHRFAPPIANPASACISYRTPTRPSPDPELTQADRVSHRCRLCPTFNLIPMV